MAPSSGRESIFVRDRLPQSCWHKSRMMTLTHPKIQTRDAVRSIKVKTFHPQSPTRSFNAHVCTLMEKLHLFPRKQPPRPFLVQSRPLTSEISRVSSPAFTFAAFKGCWMPFSSPVSSGTCAPSLNDLGQAVVHHHKCGRRSSEGSSQLAPKTVGFLTFDRINSALVVFR